MGYQSKNLSRSRRKASSARADTQGALHAAIAKIGESRRDIKKLNEKIVKDDTSNRELQVIGMYGKRKEADKTLKRADYDEFKSSYKAAIDSGEFDHPNNFFPEFEDWYVNRTKASIGGSLQSASALKQNKLDVSGLNVLMKITELQNGRK
jgi:hypothetical protein